MPDTDIRSLLQERIREAEADLDRLHAALKAVDGHPSAPAPRRQQATTKPASKVIPWGKLVSIVSQEKHGISATQLAKQTGGDQSTILALLKEHEGKTVRREGERRATRWFMIKPTYKRERGAKQKTSNGNAAMKTETGKFAMKVRKPQRG